MSGKTDPFSGKFQGILTSKLCGNPVNAGEKINFSAETPKRVIGKRCKPRPGPEVIKLFSCSTQLSRKFFVLINLRLLSTANSFLLNLAEDENLSANKNENANYSWHFHIY